MSLIGEVNGDDSLFNIAVPMP